MQTAFLAAKKSISLEPKGWENWNLLGVIAKLNGNNITFIGIYYCF